MSELHTTAPDLERQQARKPAATFLIEGRQDTADGLVLTRHMPVRMRRASGATCNNDFDDGL